MEYVSPRTERTANAARRVVVAALSVAALAAPLTVLGAQSQQGSSATAPNREAIVELRGQFLADLDTLHSKFVALAKAIPADKYNWRPGPGVRSIGEAFMHAASEYYTYAPASWNAKRSSVVAPGREGYAAFEKKSTKADVLEHLDAGWDYTKSTVGAVDPSSLTGKVKIFGGQYTITETSLGVVDDLHEHLGQLIAYARMNDIVPPWSK
ncbi:MAG: DinB family protein [Gemmatimonadaceae bacterium]